LQDDRYSLELVRDETTPLAFRILDSGRRPSRHVATISLMKSL
jgi:hypothetical protein